MGSKMEFQKAIGTQEIQTLLDSFLYTTYAHSNGVDLAVKKEKKVSSTK